MFFGKPKTKELPVQKSGSKSLDKKVSGALKASGGKCVSCHKNNRSGEALFCSRCLAGKKPTAKPKKKSAAKSSRAKTAINTTKKAVSATKRAAKTTGKGVKKVEKAASKIWGY
jgi:hypothetical protein